MFFCETHHTLWAFLEAEGSTDVVRQVVPITALPLFSPLTPSVLCLRGSLSSVYCDTVIKLFLHLDFSVWLDAFLWSFSVGLFLSNVQLENKAPSGACFSSSAHLQACSCQLLSKIWLHHLLTVDRPILGFVLPDYHILL